MLKDLLKGRPRDITPFNRKNCLNGMSLFPVRMTMNADGAFTVNKSAREILDAVEKGLVPVVIFNGYMLTLSGESEDSVKFSTCDPGEEALFLAVHIREKSAAVESYTVAMTRAEM